MRSGAAPPPIESLQRGKISELCVLEPCCTKYSGRTNRWGSHTFRKAVVIQLILPELRGIDYVADLAKPCYEGFPDTEDADVQYVLCRELQCTQRRDEVSRVIG
jgi:hypothetical protein